MSESARTLVRTPHRSGMGEIVSRDLSRRNQLERPPGIAGLEQGAVQAGGAPRRTDPGTGRNIATVVFDRDLDPHWGCWESIPASYVAMLATYTPQGQHLVGHCCPSGEVLPRSDGSLYLPVSAWQLTDMWFAIFEIEEEVVRSAAGPRRAGGIRVRAQRWRIAPGSLKRDAGPVPPDGGFASSSTGAYAGTDETGLAGLSYLPSPVREQFLRFAPQMRHQDAGLWRQTLNGTVTEHQLRGFRASGSRVIAVDAQRSTGRGPYAIAGNLHGQDWQVTVFRADFQERGNPALAARQGDLPVAGRSPREAVNR